MNKRQEKRTTEALKQKMKKIRAKTSLIKGTGCSILQTLKHLQQDIERQNIKYRFTGIPECTQCDPLCPNGN